MRIGRADFEVGNIGQVYQAVLDAIPEEEAVDEVEVRTVYSAVKEENKPSFEQVMENLSPHIIKRQIGDTSFYIRRKAWLSSAEVARRLGVSKRTVQAWGQQGVLLGRRVGGRLRFAAEAVEEWVKGDRRTGQGNGPSAQVRNTALDQVWGNEVDARYERL